MFKSLLEEFKNDIQYAVSAGVTFTVHKPENSKEIHFNSNVGTWVVESEEEAKEIYLIIGYDNIKLGDNQI